MAKRIKNPKRKYNITGGAGFGGGRPAEVIPFRDYKIAEKDCENHMDSVASTCDLLEDPVYNKLNPSQKRLIYFLFVQQKKNWSNCKTFKMAYRKGDEYSNRMASMRYSEAMNRKTIKHCRKKVMQHIQKELDDIPRKIMDEESCIAFSDVAEYFDSEGHLLVHPSNLPERVRKSISSIKAINQKNGNVVYEVSLWNKGSSLARLQSIFGMNSAEKLELSGPGGSPIKTANMNYDLSLLSYEDKRQLKELLDKCKVE